MNAKLLMDKRTHIAKIPNVVVKMENLLETLHKRYLFYHRGGMLKNWVGACPVNCLKSLLK